MRAPTLKLQHFIFITLGAALGMLAWNAYLSLLAFATLLPLLWISSPTRLIAGLTVFAYYLAAARSLPSSTYIFFGEDYPPYFGFFVWILTGILLSFPWAVLWTKTRNVSTIAWRLPLILLIVAIPPIGIFGWANPISAAGVLFPGWGWFGLAAIVVFMCCLCVFQQMMRVGLLLLFLAPLVSYAFVTNSTQLHWRGVDTQFGGITSGSYDYMRAYEINQHMLSEAHKTIPDSVIVLPESLAGRWNPPTERLWENASQALLDKGSVIIFGAEIPVGEAQYDNVLIAVGADSGVVYRQRMPVPLSMWRPLKKEGARAHWLSRGIFTIRGKSVAGLICYEQLLIWPVLISMAHSPSALIAVSNAWWGRHTSIPDIQRTVTRSWARLFNIPVIMAFNE